MKIMKMAVAVAALAAVLTGCATSTPTPTKDPKAEAIEILQGSLAAGSTGTTQAQQDAALQLAIDTLETICADPEAPVSYDAYQLAEGAQSVLEHNGMVTCEVFG